MPRRWPSIGLGAALTLTTLGGAGCAGLEHLPEDLEVGEGRLIHAEWTLDEPEFDVPRISGYIVNTYYYFAVQVQVLVEAFDEQGQLLDRRFQWLPGSVPPNHRSYFEVRNLPLAAQYRVTVPYYTWVDSDVGPFRRF